MWRFGFKHRLWEIFGSSAAIFMLEMMRMKNYWKMSDFSIFQHTDNSTWGARQMSAQLRMRGHSVGRRKARCYMDEMAIDPIYPRINLPKRQKQAQVVPYLLRNAVIDAPNQAWPIDITYIPIKRGFLYLTAIIDWHSRCIVGWELDDIFLEEGSIL